MQSPYLDLPQRAFWRQAVAERHPGDPGDVYRPRFAITKADRIMTAGSCFAQHVGRSLRETGFNVIDVEPAPETGSSEVAARFGYGLFSARYGNVYTVRQLVQLFDEAQGRVSPADPVWERDGLFFDAQRPNVEPDGLDSPETVLRLRADHLARVRDAFAQADVFVFTFGLTEAFVHTATGTVYPTAPGTIAGNYDPAVHSFKNYRFGEILGDFLLFRDRLKAINPAVRFLVTTSPVPLTATASGNNVEVATAYSKAVLRAVCGELYDSLDDVDYFPSYEIITSQKAGGGYYETNVRSVAAHGVQAAMATFMNAHGVAAPRPSVIVGRLVDLAAAFVGTEAVDARRRRRGAVMGRSADGEATAALRAAEPGAAATVAGPQPDRRTERRDARREARREERRSKRDAAATAPAAATNGDQAKPGPAAERREERRRARDAAAAARAAAANGDGARPDPAGERRGGRRRALGTAATGPAAAADGTPEGERRGQRAGGKAAGERRGRRGERAGRAKADAVCEEALLEAFGR